MQRLGLADDELAAVQNDRARWPEMRARFTAIFGSKTRDEWCEIMEGSDVCFAPVLTLAESREHPHAKARGSFVDVGGAQHPQPAPRFSRTPGVISGPAEHAGDAAEVLAGWGVDRAQVEKLRSAGAPGGSA